MVSWCGQPALLLGVVSTGQSVGRGKGLVASTTRPSHVGRHYLRWLRLLWCCNCQSCYGCYGAATVKVVAAHWLGIQCKVLVLSAVPAIYACRSVKAPGPDTLWPRSDVGSLLPCLWQLHSKVHRCFVVGCGVYAFVADIPAKCSQACMNVCTVAPLVHRYQLAPAYLGYQVRLSARCGQHPGRRVQHPSIVTPS